MAKSSSPVSSKRTLQLTTATWSTSAVRREGKGPVGQIDARVCAIRARGAAVKVGKSAALKNSCREAIQRQAGRELPASKNFTFVFTEIVNNARIPPH